MDHRPYGVLGRGIDYRDSDMIKIDCASVSIVLALPPCNTHVGRATLSRPHCHTYELPIEVNPEGFPTGTVAFDLPDAKLPRGVWRLTLDTECGCFSMSVWVDCPAPSTLGQHTATSEPGPTIVCCEPEAQHDWTQPPVHFQLKAMPPGYSYRLGQETDPAGTALVIMPPPPAEYDRWVLRDDTGIVRGEGDILPLNDEGVSLTGYTTCIISPDSWLELTT